MQWIDVLKSAVQGLVQGITEWLPISSTGHILLLNSVWKMNVSEDFFDLYEVVIQLGSILAVVVMYFHRLNPFSPKKSADEKAGTWKMWGKVLIASVPAAVVGLILEKRNATQWMETSLTIAIALIVYGIAFLLIERFRKTAKVQNLDELKPKVVLGIGAFQMLALIPGTSRSGSTILGASLLGASRPLAAEFSFFMAIPVMLGASGLRLLLYIKDFGLSFSATEWAVLAVGTLVAFLVSLVVIRFFMSYIRKHDFKVFGVYRIALGAVILLVMALAPSVLQVA